MKDVTKISKAVKPVNTKPSPNTIITILLLAN